jgi:protein O-mannosyl-transferase
VDRSDVRPFVAALVVLTVAVFGGTLGNKFTMWDDKTKILDNPNMTAPAWPHLATQWLHPIQNSRPYDMFIPVTHSLWWATYNLSSIGTGPDHPHPRSAWFHALNLLLHAATGVVVFFLLNAFLEKLSPAGFRRNTAAWLGAALFAVHPVQVESAVWVCGTRDLLFGLCGALALLSFVRLRYGWAAAFCLIGYFSKPTSVVIPALMAAVWIFTTDRKDFRALNWIGLLILLALPIIAINRVTHDNDLIPRLPLWTRPFIAADALVFYAGKLIWPLHLGVDYGRRPDVVIRMAATPMVAAVVLSCGLALFFFRRRIPKATWLCLAFFLIPILPVLGFLPFVLQHKSTVADHYLYLSMAGPALGLSWYLSRTQRRAAFYVSGAFLVFLGALSFRQTAVWKDDVTLFGHAIKVNPRSTAALGNLGVAHLFRGDRDAAVKYWQETLEINPNDVAAQANLERFGKTVRK